MTQLIAMMRTKAIDNSNYGTEEHTVWTLFQDVVIEVIATASEIIYTAIDGIDTLETEDVDEFLWKLEGALS